MKSRNIYGLTLVELVVVLTIVSILATIALVNVNARRKEDEVRDGAYKFSALLAEARNQAINSRSRVMFRFNNTTIQWCVTSCYISGTLPKSIEHKFTWTKILRYARESVLPGMTPSVTYTAGSGWIHFYIEPDGTLIGYTSDTTPRGITVYFQHDKDATRRYRTTVLPILGKARIYPKW